MSQKVLALEKLSGIRKVFGEEGKTVVFTNGCFDLLHGGHIHLFREAKKHGDILIVAVNDDLSVKRLKGALRPVYPLDERLEILEAVLYIDYLVVFSENTPQRIIGALLPDVLVKGGDWKPNQVVGRKEVEEAGGRVVIVPYKKEKSTSRLLSKITDRQ